MKIGVLGVTFDGDGNRPEIENPPAGFRKAGLTGSRFGHNDQLTDYGDIEIPAFEGNYRTC